MTENTAALEREEDRTTVRGEAPGTAAHDGTVVGTAMDDGSVFAGVTRDGRMIYALPRDLGCTATFNDTVRAVQGLNEEKALGHDDWEIPDLDALKVLQRNQERGSLRGTFEAANKGSGKDYPFWYWSSTKGPELSSLVHFVRFSEGDHMVDREVGGRMSCRPVRIVDVKP